MTSQAERRRRSADRDADREDRDPDREPGKSERDTSKEEYDREKHGDEDVQISVFRGRLAFFEPLGTDLLQGRGLGCVRQLVSGLEERRGKCVGTMERVAGDPRCERRSELGTEPSLVEVGEVGIALRRKL